MDDPSKSAPWGLVVFVALLCGACGRGGGGEGRSQPPPASPPADSFAIRFVDATEEAGISFRHVHGGRGLRHLPETMGGSAAWLDFDGDGRFDLFLGQSGPLPDEKDAPPARNALYRNLGGGRFEDVTDRAGDAASTGYGQGVAAADFDGDGRVDLYVTNWGPNVLLRNADGSGRFEDVTERAGVGDARWSTSAAFFDADLDGDLDLYVANYVRYRVEMARTMTGGEGRFLAYPHPDRFRAARDTLYRNEGNGRFRDVTQEAGIRDVDGKGLGVAPADLDDDGDVDLYVANDSTPNFLFENLGDGRFEDRTMTSNAAYNADGRTEAGMGIAVGDVDGDLDLDIFVTNLDGETNTLYVNLGGLTFEDRTRRNGLALDSMLFVGFGTAFLDADLDGDLDLLVGNGHIIDNIEVIDPGSGTTYAQRTLLFENLGGGRFREAGDRLPPALGVRRVVRAAALCDYDGDGDVDVVYAQNNAAAVLLRNESARRGHWLGLLALDDHGAPVPNVRVEVRVGDRTRRFDALPFGSYCSTHDPRVWIGEPGGTLDRLTVRFPTGELVELENVACDGFLTVRPDGSVERRP